MAAPSRPRVLVGVTGSVATIRLPLLVKTLIEEHNAEVKVVATTASLNFFQPQEIPLIDQQHIYKDKDEYETWKGKGDPILHIEVR